MSVIQTKEKGRYTNAANHQYRLSFATSGMSEGLIEYQLTTLLTELPVKYLFPLLTIGALTKIGHMREENVRRHIRNVRKL